MSVYKLSAEEIRERAKDIATLIAQGFVDEDDIIKLLIDATGEKVPELFDESKVVHGSVWKICNDPLLVIEDTDGEMVGLWPDGRLSRSLFRLQTRPEMISALKNENAIYLGQFDFVAGMPKD